MSVSTNPQQGTKTMPGMWSFDRSAEWVNKYGKCSNKATRKAPLNIDTSKVVACNALCRLGIKYEPTTCSVSMTNNIPTVSFSPNCVIKFKNEFYYLRKMTIHVSSMHTINQSYYDMEVLLYHNRNPISDSDGGVILSVLMKKGEDYGNANEFMNEFINKMPTNEMPIEKDISVSKSWNPEQLFPMSKAFFYYEGALPYPPCNQNWTFIVFEEALPISQNIIDTVGKYILGDNPNNRPIQKKPRDINIFYNANSQLDTSVDMTDADTLEMKPTLPVVNNLSSSSWLKRNIYYIKGIIITLVLILMIYIAIKFASIIVKNDMLNSFIIRQLKKKEERQIEEAQKAQAEQQALESGGVQQPTQRTNISNNDNNNNNNNDNNNDNDKKKRK